MSTSFIDNAYRALNTAIQSNDASAPTRRILSEQVGPLLQQHIAQIQSDIAGIRHAGLPLTIKDAPLTLQDSVRELRGFLLDAERRLNAKEFKKGIAPTFGSDLKKNWMRRLFKDATDVRAICELTDATVFQNEQERIVKTVRTPSKVDGAKKMLAQSKVSLASPSKGPGQHLLHVMHELSNAARYELLSKVDLYIRSGHAENDFSAKNKDTKALRDAFLTLDKTPFGTLGYIDALSSACNALYARFDDLFQKVSVRTEKNGSGKIVAKNHGSLKDNKDPEQKEFECEKVAASGYIDSVIYSVDKKILFGGLVTSNDKTINLLTQGEQLGKQLLGLESLLTKGQKVDITSIMRATYHNGPVRRSSSREEFFNQVKLDPTNAVFAESLDKLQALTVLCALPNAAKRSMTRFLLVGKELDWNPDDYDAVHLPSSAIKVIKPIIERLTHSDFRLRANSTRDSLVNQVAQSLHSIVAQFKNTNEMRAEQPFLQEASNRLGEIVEEAGLRSHQNIVVSEIETLSEKLGSIKPLVQSQESNVSLT